MGALEGRPAVVPGAAPAVGHRARPGGHRCTDGRAQPATAVRAPEPSFPLTQADSSPLETLALWALGTLGAIAAALWAAGELAGRAFGGAWPHVGAAEM